MNRIYLLLLWWGWGTLGLSAQDHVVHFDKGDQHFSANVAMLTPLEWQSSFYQGRYRVFVQFDHLLTYEEQQRLKAEDVQLLEYIPNRVYTASIPTSMMGPSLSQWGIRSVQALQSNHKLSQRLEEQNYPDWAMEGPYVTLSIQYFKDINPNLVKNALKAKGGSINASMDHVQQVVLQILPSQIADLAAQPYIRYVDLMSDPGEPESDDGRHLHRANAIDGDYYGARNYDGTGITFAINDDGFVGPHIDFKGRTNQQDVAGDFTGSHGDMTAGIAGGAGNLDPSIRGMATGAYLHIRQYNTNSLADLRLHQDSAVLIFSSSYSNGCNAGYTNTTRLVDDEIYNYPFLMQTFSAGNSNNRDCGYGAGNQWANITGGHKMGKNVITTANLNANDGIANSSSRGPANDGRIKPDLAAHGAGQLSNAPNNTYRPGGGTSAAAPGICGVMAQLHHAYQDLNSGAIGPSALLKATLLVTANDLGNDGPDFIYGWGKVNGLRAVQLLEDGHHFTDSLTQGNINTHIINIPAGVQRANVMIYWADPAASTSAATALVNDLDATITNGSNTYLPWLLDPTPNATTLALPAGKGADHLNNVEEIAIDNPTAGAYTLTVAGTAVPMGVQQYYVVYEFLTEDITVTYPMGGEGIEPNSSTRIHWDAYGTAGTFSVEYSTDNGASWTTINGAVPGDERFITWNTPATVSGRALVRVTRGTTSDQSDAIFTLMERPQNLRVTRACASTSSIRLVWDTVPSATEYDIYLLGAQYMDSIGSTTGTTVDVPVADINDEQWFSVRARGANDLRSMRQIAVHYGGTTGNNNSCLLGCSSDNDAGLSGITSPNAIIQDCASPTRPVTVDLENLGLFTETNIPVYYQLDSDPVVAEIYPGSLAPNGSASYTFNTLLAVPSAGTHRLRIWTDLATDSTVCNDTLALDLTVLSPIGNFPFLEDFESGQFPSIQSFVENPDNAYTWESVSTTGANGNLTNAMYINNYSYNAQGQRDIFNLASIDLTNASSGAGAELTFDVAHRPFSTTLVDELEVEISSNCGTTYTTVYSKAGTTLATDSMFTSSWAPSSANDWRNDTIDLSAYLGNVVQIRFVNINGYGNNTYVDNINVTMTGNIAPTASFRSDVRYTCDGAVEFQDLSGSQPTQWYWDFGDGDTSTVRNPNHVYTTSGLYTVSLRVTNAFGVDMDVKTAYIEVELPEITSYSDGRACLNGDIDLTATSNHGDLYWYNASSNLVHIGDTLTIPNATTTANYQVQNVVTSPTQAAGPVSGTAVGGGGYHGSGFYGIINFTAFRSFEILSVWVDANGAGPRTFTLWDGSISNGGTAPTNNVLQTTTVTLDSGPQRVRLDFVVPGPGIYSIGGNNMDLFRNNTGVSYPYSLPGILRMTSSAANTPNVFYYYLYDWRVRTDSCAGPLQPVTAEVVEAEFSSVGSAGVVAFTDASVGATSWHWDFGDGDTSTVQNPTHTYNSPGSYWVTLTINNGICSFSDSVNIAVGVRRVQGGLDVVLLPNPTYDNMVVRFGRPLKQPMDLTVLGTNGQTVLHRRLATGTQEHRLDVRALPAAVYWIRLQTDQFVETRKLIVSD